MGSDLGLSSTTGPLQPVSLPGSGDPVLEAGKAKIKMPADLIPGESSLPGL